MEIRRLMPGDEGALEAFLLPRIATRGLYAAELRGRGYARCAVAASLPAARDEGATLGVLFTAADNAAAQRAYRALGFGAVGAFRLLMLREPWALDR